MKPTEHQSESALKLAQRKLSKLVENGMLLSRTKDRNVLMKHILMGSQDIAHCEAVTLFLKTDRNTLTFGMRTNDNSLPTFELPMFNPDGSPNEHFVVTHVASHNQAVIIDDVEHDQDHRQREAHRHQQP